MGKRRGRYKAESKLEINGGPGGIRTPYLLNANQAFSQMNYGPIVWIPLGRGFINPLYLISDF